MGLVHALSGDPDTTESAVGAANSIDQRFFSAFHCLAEILDNIATVVEAHRAALHGAILEVDYTDSVRSEGGGSLRLDSAAASAGPAACTLATRPRRAGTTPGSTLAGVGGSRSTWACCAGRARDFRNTACYNNWTAAGGSGAVTLIWNT